jgi:hypothetical protein
MGLMWTRVAPLMSVKKHTGIGGRNPAGSDAVTANSVRSRIAAAKNKEKSLLSGRFPILAELASSFDNPSLSRSGWLPEYNQEAKC